MKIIYEDGADRSQTEHRSGAQVPPPNTAPEELPNLTPEQISALLQILANQQTAQPAPKKSEQTPPQDAPKDPAQDPGTRILYQSADFEPLEAKKSGRPRRIAPDPGTRIAFQAKDPDELREERERRRAAQQGNFSVNEFSLVDDLPQDDPMPGDLAVREVDEATEAFHTRYAKRVQQRANVPQEPPVAQEPDVLPDEPAEKTPTQFEPEPSAQAQTIPEAPQAQPEKPRAAQAAPPRAPIPAVAVGESADENALERAAKAQEDRLQEAARLQEEKAREEQEREAREALEREREAKERAQKEAEAAEAERLRLEEAQKAEKAARAQAKLDAKAQKAQAKLDAQTQKAQAKTEKAEQKAQAKAEKAQAKLDRQSAKAQAERKPWSPTRKIVLTVSILAILASLGVLAREYKLHKDNLALENQLSDLVLETQVAAPMVGGNTITLTDEQQWAQLRGEFPGIVFPEGLQLKYARLYATNSDFAGYLEIPGLNTSLPVVQTTNDADYLNKNFLGKSTKYGCPFVSCINNIATLDFNTVIYGHHMNDHTIFGALDAYQKIDGFRKAPVITFNTMYADYNWKVVAVFLTNAVPADDNGYVFNYYFNQLSSDEKKTEYFAALKERSLYDTGVDLLPTDQLLTLSTCSHVFDDARLVVVARMVRPGESSEVDTSLATLNNAPHYPQVYYSKKKQTNPYAQTPRWEVG